MAPALALALLLAAHASAQVHAEGQAGEPSTAAPAQRLAAIALSIRSRAIQDSRCYLMNGGAVESFFVSEDLPVGSVIGVLSVNGDPSAAGDIALSVQERGAAVGVAAGSKNVTLLRPLDREEKAGPSNVYVNVRCDRRRTADPSFIIPVSVRVWDVNDNAPAWVGAPYRARMAETAGVGARVPAALRAADADQPGPHATLHYSVLPGPHAEYVEFANELDSTLVLRKQLDYETARNLSVVVRARDGGAPPLHADAALTIEVLDADDQNPRFDHDHYTVLLPDDAVEGTELEPSPAAIAARDGDAGINAPVEYSAAGGGGGGGWGEALLAVERATGRLRATARLLAAPLPATVVIKATQVDNPDRYALATVGVRRARGAGAAGGADGAAGGATGETRAVRFTQRAYHVSAREDARAGAVLAALYTDPPAHAVPGGLQFYVSERGFLEQFAINARGELVLRRSLDFETRAAYCYLVMATDGATNDTATLNISVVNVNEWEPRFKHPHYEFRVEAPAGAGAGAGAGAAGGAGGAGLLPVGRLDVHDGDAPDTVSLSLRGEHAHMFYVSAAGEVFLRAEALAALPSPRLQLLATAVDSGAPPRQTSVPVVVHVSEQLLAAGAGAGAGAGARGGVLLVFAAALALLALLVCALLAYIYRNKRRSKSVSPGAGAGKAAAAAGGGGGGLARGAAAAGSAGSLASESAGASTILANSSSSLDLRDSLPAHARSTTTRQSTRFPAKKIAPSPPAPAPPAATGAAGGGGGEALMSDHVGAGGGGGRSGVAWPAHTIPARVKKLSWDDAQAHPPAQGSGEAVDATNPALHDHLNLTVYF